MDIKQIKATKDYILYQSVDNPKLTYHAGIDESKGEIIENMKQKLKAVSIDVISLKSLKELGFCDYGIKDCAKVLCLDIKKEYKLDYIEDRLKNNIPLAIAYEFEVKRLWPDFFYLTEEQIKKALEVVID